MEENETREAEPLAAEAPPEQPPAQPSVQPPTATQYITVLPYGMTPQTYEEKKKIRSSANTIGISLLITEGVIAVWGFVYFAVMGFLGFSQKAAREAVSDPAALQMLQIVLTTVAFLIPALIVFKAREHRISETVLLSKPKKGIRLPMFFFGMAFCMFANIAVSILEEFFSKFGMEFHMPEIEDPPGIIGFLLSVLATAVFPGLIEEFVFRGLIFGSLRKYGEGFAILSSAILFGLMHGNFEQMPFAFLVGLALGFIVAQTGSLWIAMAVHASNNMISVLFSYGFKDLPSQVENLIFTVLLMALMTAGVACLRLTGGLEGGFHLKKAEMEAKEKQKYKWLFFAPAVLIFVCICLLNSVLSL